MIAASLDKHTALLLSLNRAQGRVLMDVVGASYRVRTRSKHQNYIICLLQSPIARYFACVVKRVTLHCWQVLQKIVDLPSLTVYLMVILQVDTSFA